MAEKVITVTSQTLQFLLFRNLDNYLVSCQACYSKFRCLCFASQDSPVWYSCSLESRKIPALASDRCLIGLRQKVLVNIYKPKCTPVGILVTLTGMVLKGWNDYSNVFSNNGTRLLGSESILWGAVILFQSGIERTNHQHKSPLAMLEYVGSSYVLADDIFNSPIVGGTGKIL